MCLVEICDAFATRPAAGDAVWPVVLAASLVVVSGAAAVAFVASGAAERRLGAGPAPVVRCTRAEAG